MASLCNGKRRHCLKWILWCALVSVFSPPWDCLGLEPDEILIVANRKVDEGVELARYYAKRRHIPNDHLLLLDLPPGEVCSRDRYEQEIAGPVRRRLKKENGDTSIRCVVMMYGLPLKVAAPQNETTERFKALRAQVRELGKQSKKQNTDSHSKTSSNAAGDLAETRNHLNQQSIAELQWNIGQAGHNRASLVSNRQNCQIKSSAEVNFL